MKKTKTIIILTLSILLFSYTVNAEEKQETTTKLNKDVEIEVLKERIKALDEKVNNQQKTLKDELVLRSEALEKAMDSKYESIEKLINVSITGIGIIFSIILGFLTFFGYKTIKGTVKKIIEPQAKTVIKQLLKDLKQKGEKSINDITVDLKKQLSGFDTSKPIPKNTRKILDEFEDMLTQVNRVNRVSACFFDIEKKTGTNDSIHHAYL